MKSIAQRSLTFVTAGGVSRLIAARRRFGFLRRRLKPSARYI
jgi:hypothetical protein